MTALRSYIQRCGAAVLLTAILLILGGSWVGGIHQHDSPRSHTCVLCTSAHAPAIVSDPVVGLPAPSVDVCHRPDLTLAIPTFRAAGLAPSRAPPLA